MVGKRPKIKNKPIANKASLKKRSFVSFFMLPPFSLIKAFLNKYLNAGKLVKIILDVQSRPLTLIATQTLQEPPLLEKKKGYDIKQLRELM